MANKKENPTKNKALQIFLEMDGEIKNPELAELVGEGCTSDQIRKWKCVDKWKDLLLEQQSHRKRGAQKGNKNAKGHGAPVGNENAVTHGAYKKVCLDDLSPEDRERIEKVTGNTQLTMLWELTELLAKETDLQNRISALRDKEGEGKDEFYTDRIVEMLVPKTKDDVEDEYYTKGKDNVDPNALKVAMNTVIKASPFDRAMRLEAELNKVHGRVIKILDTIKSYELDNKRLELEQKRYTLMKQKITGVYDIDEDTGEIDDTYIEDDIEGLDDDV